MPIEVLACFREDSQEGYSSNTWLVMWVRKIYPSKDLGLLTWRAILFDLVDEAIESYPYPYGLRKCPLTLSGHKKGCLETLEASVRLYESSKDSDYTNWWDKTWSAQ